MYMHIGWAERDTKRGRKGDREKERANRKSMNRKFLSLLSYI